MPPSDTANRAFRSRVERHRLSLQRRMVRGQFRIQDVIEKRICTESENLLAEGAVIGTARMGADPKSSVVDADLRSHDHPNLFILGSAVFPTSATANPTLTIAALALRAAAPVKAMLSQ